MRQWRHTEPAETRAAFLIVGPRCIRVPAQTGSITVGSEHVFHAYFVTIEMPDKTRFVGEDRRSIVAALEALNGKLKEAGYRLLASGLDRRFYEMNFSVNTGVGLIEDHEGWVHMLDAPPYPRTDRAKTTVSSFSGQIAVS